MPQVPEVRIVAVAFGEAVMLSAQPAPMAKQCDLDPRVKRAEPREQKALNAVSVVKVKWVYGV